MFKSRGAAVDKANDCMIFEAKQFEIPNEPRPIDVLQRRAVIGEYYFMQNHLRGAVKPDEYRSSMRDIFLYNEDKDGFSRVTLETALKNCARFDASDGRLEWHGLGAPGDARSKDEDWTYNGDRAAPLDMFAHYDNGKMKPTRYFGDMHTSHLREEGLSDWAESVCEKLKSKYPDIVRALGEGVEVCRLIDEAAGANAEAQEYWFTWQYLMHATAHKMGEWDEVANIPIIPTKEEVDSAYAATVKGSAKGVDFFSNGRLLRAHEAGGDPEDERITRDRFTVEIFHSDSEIGVDMFTPEGKARFMPVGYSNWAGLTMLADTKYEKTFPQLQEKAARFVKAFERLYDELSSRFTDSTLLDKTRQPPWFYGKDGRQTLFSNVFHATHAPISFKLKKRDGSDNLDASFPSPPVFGKVSYPWRMGFQVDTKDAGVGPLQRAADPTSVAVALMARHKALIDFDVLMSSITDLVKDDDSRKSILAAATAFAADGKLKPFLVAVLQSVEKPSPQEASIVEDSAELVANLFIQNRGMLFNKQAANTLINFIMEYKYGRWSERSDELKHEVIANIHVLLSLSCLGSASTPWQLATGILAFGSATRSLMANEASGVAPDDEAAEKEFKIALKGQQLDTIEPPPDVPAPTETSFPTGHFITHQDANRRAHPLLNTVDRSTFVITSLTASPANMNRMAPSKVAEDSVWNVLNYTFTPGTPETVIFEKHSARAAPFGGHGAAAFMGVLSEEGVAYDAEVLSPAGAGGFYGARFASSRGGPFDGEGADLRRKRVRGAARTSAPHAEEEELEAKGFVYVSDTMEQRWRLASREVDPLVRAAKLVFLASPVNGTTLQTLIRANDVFPFGFLLFRPYMTYLMGSGILTVAGRGTGETLIGHADFQLADNVVQKMHIGNFTMYLKSIVYQQQNVYIAENIFAQGYLSGNGMEFWTPEKSRKVTLDSFDNSTPSIFSCLVPYDGPRQDGDYFLNEYPNPLDVTGHYSTTNPALEHLSANKEMHYATARFYSQLHRFDNSTSADLSMAFGSYNRFNTMTFSGHQAMYNPTSRNYDLVQAGTGHWGNRIYAGEFGSRKPQCLRVCAVVLTRLFHVPCFRLWQGQEGPPEDARAGLLQLRSWGVEQPQHGLYWVLVSLWEVFPRLERSAYESAMKKPKHICRALRS